MNLKLILIAGAVAAVGMAMGQGAPKPGQGGGKGMMRQGGPGGPGGGMRRQMPTADERVKMMTKMLNLTPAQQKKLKPIYEASAKKQKALMADKKMTDQQKRAAFQKMRDENRKKVAAILTKDQIKKMDDMRAKMRQGGGPGRPGAPGGMTRGGAPTKASGMPPGVNPNGSMKKGKHGGVG